jgi:hypothetical protein
MGKRTLRKDPPPSQLETVLHDSSVTHCHIVEITYPTALNQKIVNVQKPHVLLISTTTYRR